MEINQCIFLNWWWLHLEKIWEVFIAVVKNLSVLPRLTSIRVRKSGNQANTQRLPQFFPHCCSAQWCDYSSTCHSNWITVFWSLFYAKQSKSGHVRVRARILYVYCGAHIRSDPVVAFPLNIFPFFEKRDTVQIFALLK